MKEMEDALNNKKIEFDRMEVPAELEERLRTALNRRKRGISKGSIAAVLLAFIVFSYSFDALAYYGKKILGYDEITYGSIQKLTDDGWGQKIGKSVTFSNNVELTLDGIMFDDNELVTFYKLHSENKELDHNLPMFRLNGIKPIGYFQRSGHGKIIDEYTQVWIQLFEPPAFYEKWMKLNVQLTVNGRMEEREIRFALDRNAAMKRTVQRAIDARVKIDQYDIVFDALSASALSTEIEGSIVPLTDDAAKAFQAEDAIKGLESPRLRFDIVADGAVVSSAYAGMGASNNDISFSASAEALPEVVKTLEIKNIGLERSMFIDKSLEISQDTKELAVAEDVAIRRVELDGDNTIVTVLSRGIPVMGLFVGDEQLEGEDGSTYNYEAESAEPVERVFTFKGKGEKMKLAVKAVRYLRFSDVVISIPVE